MVLFIMLHYVVPHSSLLVKSYDKRDLSVIVREHPHTIPEGGWGYCHIRVIQVGAAMKGMVFRQCTLG